MIDTSTSIGRAVAASMRLAEKRSWREISMLDIADEAGLTLVELSRQVSSKAAVLRAFARLVDEEVLRKAERREPEESLRERLFDVLMMRLEAMAPYRPALRRIVAQAPVAPELARAVMVSQGWMLVAAGIPVEGLSGGVRVAGLASVYAATFRDWLDDDDAGLARTMAALDRRLRRGESWIQSFDAVAAAGQTAAGRAQDLVGRIMRRRKSTTTSKPRPATGPTAPGGTSAPAPNGERDSEPPASKPNLH